MSSEKDFPSVAKVYDNLMVTFVEVCEKHLRQRREIAHVVGDQLITEFSSGGCCQDCLLEHFGFDD